MNLGYHIFERLWVSLACCFIWSSIHPSIPVPTRVHACVRAQHPPCLPMPQSAMPACPCFLHGLTLHLCHFTCVPYRCKLTRLYAARMLRVHQHTMERRRQRRRWPPGWQSAAAGDRWAPQAPERMFSPRKSVLEAEGAPVWVWQAQRSAYAATRPSAPSAVKVDVKSPDSSRGPCKPAQREARALLETMASPLAPRALGQRLAAPGMDAR